MKSKILPKIRQLTAKAIHDYQMIEPGDRIMVGISGGKDSYTLLHLLEIIRRASPIPFEILACHLNQGHPGFPVDKLQNHLESTDIPWVIHSEDTYSIVKAILKPGDTTCSLCSRLRRGILYKVMRDNNCNKLALGHHREDTITTLLMSILYSGQIKAMPAKLQNDAGDLMVIRPMIYVPEPWIIDFSIEMEFDTIPCTLCSTQDNLKRDEVGQMIEDLNRRNPTVKGNILNALQKVITTHLLDHSLLPEMPASGDLEAELFPSMDRSEQGVPEILSKLEMSVN